MKLDIIANSAPMADANPDALTKPKKGKVEIVSANAYTVLILDSIKSKLKLIMNGFGEAATAAYGIREFLFPDKSFHFEYSTNSGVVGLG